MLPSVEKRDSKLVRRRLFASLVSSTDLIDSFAMTYDNNDQHWLQTVLGPTFTMSSVSSASVDGTKTLVTSFRTWLQAHEEAQVMLASVLVVLGMWWLVRTIMSLLINIICPILVVFFAVMCIPQLRAPLLGQNYPLLANLMRDIFLKMAENMKT
ncbi:uncharacterized protein LOC123714327 [Pieris brassicae]|uniref:Uncharacterized protein n=1 Tax=Pieris brassicae TaxID=7116 RepID=A0A9P0SVI8_PIEBR|nr:uncharacterized protein LOC123714327 [Pieris brassicae]CAH3954710.1 unnamed protein product [Pieris brassicae]